MLPNDTPELRARFWAKVAERPPVGCWLWSAGCFEDGYGVFGGPWATHRAHKIAWALASDEWPPDGYHVAHICDTPLCVRNDDVGTYELNGVLLPRFGHLFVCTSAQNVADRVAKGRSATGDRSGPRLYRERMPRGTANTEAKLTDAEVQHIRTLHAVGDRSYPTLARQFHISTSQVFRIVHRLSWRHLP